MLAALVASPALFEWRDRVQSDIPFAFWCVAALLAAERRRAGWLGWCVFAAITTRTVGIALPVALAAWLLLDRGPGRARLGAAVAIGSVAAVLAGRSTGADAGTATYLTYFEMLRPSSLPAFALETLRSYAGAVVAFFGISFGRLANAPVLALIMLMLGIGFAVRAVNQRSPLEVFVATFLAVLFVFPVHGEATRYALPALLFAPLYLLTGWDRMAGGLGLPRFAPVAAALILAVCEVPFYGAHDLLAPRSHPASDAGSRALYAAIRALPPDATPITREPRIVALFTGRRAVSWVDTRDGAGFWRIVRAYHVGYALQELDVPKELRAGSDRILARNAAALEPVFANARFRLQRIQPQAAGQRGR